MASNRDYYEVLGVSKTASADEIKRAYRKLAREFHPDVNKETGAADKFKEINEAYQTLSDPNKRSQYDYYGKAGAGAGAGPGAGGFGDFGGGFQGFEGFGEFGDIFDVFFGGGGRGRRPQQERGADLRFDLRLNLEDAAKGLEKEITLPHFVPCETCKGSGAKPGTTPKKCSACNGSGQIKKTQRTILGSFTQAMPCSNCRGTGSVISTPCSTCHGEGRIKKSHKIKVKIPAGIDTGHRLRVAGAGDAGPKGATPGDLYVFINVEPHINFNREAENLFHRTKISFTQAILGDEIEVPTLEGKATLKIPAGTQPNTNFRLKGKGMPVLQRRDRGDLYVLVEIEIPKKVSSQQAELLKKFKDA
ncbi:molecular chaperone DnaJ [candidate division WOR-1 bacterium RIFOXYB2_FULL_42_35]|uniref:Chaperone protein DnaJ n=1 Tax=candidate division WOR-1 bacterium RIFOXYC2_FULL_41_25 TaxID=1802586 RepID=A0A1F4TM55_UNCSA|nr:MAG: molecular chaperone DnaJ [candidate division WOR-1 bacterium RIFOXYA2_FULL_41_14]OGC24134.1 MAG: molecular chaperone DnaJ [candidate division WOR-1 bacterium RIFOXYB2_FULL_42_35]OGC33821.1 MAG: molecular chaperone DnaJ [candidate division WOR-1 bacterium RIFOXYC2_FULL_41_25]OGC41819.1 MAG: molecular chaperone DnaJ [candidate division WOR-1 bacterium RIFOXYD2_FULL_41_8]